LIIVIYALVSSLDVCTIKDLFSSLLVSSIA